jgi:hypothetical protein
MAASSIATVQMAFVVAMAAVQRPRVMTAFVMAKSWASTAVVAPVRGVLMGQPVWVIPIVPAAFVIGEMVSAGSHGLRVLASKKSMVMSRSPRRLTASVRFT